MFCDGLMLCFNEKGLSKIDASAMQLLKSDFAIQMRTAVEAIKNIKPDWNNGKHWVSFYQSDAQIRKDFLSVANRTVVAFT
jgi:hypothetical protein